MGSQFYVKNSQLISILNSRISFQTFIVVWRAFFQIETHIQYQMSSQFSNWRYCNSPKGESKAIDHNLSSSFSVTVIGRFCGITVLKLVFLTFSLTFSLAFIKFTGKLLRETYCPEKVRFFKKR